MKNKLIKNALFPYFGDQRLEYGMLHTGVELEMLDEPKSTKRISEIQSRCYSEILNAIQFGLFNNDLLLYHRDCYFEFENGFEFMRNGLLCEKWTFAVST